MTAKSFFYNSKNQNVICGLPKTTARYLLTDKIKLSFD